MKCQHCSLDARAINPLFALLVVACVDGVGERPLSMSSDEGFVAGAGSGATVAPNTPDPSNMPANPLPGTGNGGSGVTGSEGLGPSGLTPGQGVGGGMGSAGSVTGAGCELPETFAWSSGAPAISPVSDATHDLVAVKDPTLVFYQDRWHVYASSVTRAGAYGMVYTSFADWDEAPSAPLYYMDQTPGFNTYVAAPQLFYFAPGNKWYLIFQSGPPMYSTADDPGDPTAWTRPAPFFAAEPAIITQNDGWLDYWVICDAPSCHLFFSDDHGRWYRATTSVAEFPLGFDDPIIVMQDAEAGRLFEGSSVYQVSGTNQYLALVEAFDATSNWKRYFRSWTAEGLDGPWSPLRDSGTSPFVGPANVAFEGDAWTLDISHGELVRAGYDQTMALDACNLQFAYQGFDPTADTTNYNAIPWNIGLLTQAP